MHVCSFVRRQTIWLAVALLSFLTLPTRHASAGPAFINPPAITVQPTNALAGSGEDVAFTVSAVDGNIPPQPLTFHWRVNGTIIAGANVSSSANSSTLIVSNLTTATYSVIVSNMVTNVVSSNATLLVVNPVPRRLGTGLITATTNVGTTNVFVPITLRGSGREKSASFTLLFTNAFTNTQFATTLPNSTVTTTLGLIAMTNITANPTNTSGPPVTNVFRSGAAGVTVRLNSGTIPPGLQTLGTFQFDLVGSNRANFDAALKFATNLAPIAATNANGASLAITANVDACLEPISPQPTLQTASGLYISSMNVKNPGMDAIPVLDVFALKLGNAVSNVLVSNQLGVVVSTNRFTNLVTYANAQGATTARPLNDPVIFAVDGRGSNCPIDLTLSAPSLPYAQLRNLQPGESRTVTLEFAVPGNPTTLSNAAFAIYRGTALNLIAYVNINPIPKTMTSTGMGPGSVFYLEFNTLRGHTYYIQYVDQLPFSSTNANTVFPGVPGTGGVVRWVDNGSPKTDLPFKGAHFFRVFESF